MKNRTITFLFVYLFAFCVLGTVPAFAGEIVEEEGDIRAAEIIDSPDIVEDEGELRAVPDIIIEDELGSI